MHALSISPACITTLYMYILNIVIVIHWYTGFYAKSVKNLSTPDMTIESTISTIYDYYIYE